MYISPWKYGFYAVKICYLLISHGSIKEAWKRLCNYLNSYVFKYMESIYKSSSPTIYSCSGNNSNLKNLEPS